jgi:hypothetical protein
MKYSIIILFLSICSEFNAQFYGGIFPLTGATYNREGIWGKDVEFDLDGQTWISNRLPIDKKFEIKLVEPTGLRTDKAGNYKPGIELLILSNTKDTLGYAENMLENVADTWDEFMLKNLSISLTFNSQSKPGDSLIIVARFFDFNSSNKLTIQLPVVIVAPSEELMVSSTLYSANSYKGFDAASSCFPLSGLMTVIEDTLNTKSFKIKVPEVENLNKQSFLSGKHVLKIYDKLGNFMEEVREPVLNIEANLVKTDLSVLNIQFPLESKTDYKNLILRYSWENKLEVLDIIYYVPAK